MKKIARVFLNAVLLSCGLFAGATAFAYKNSCEFAISSKFDFEATVDPRSPEYKEAIKNLVSTERVLQTMKQYQQMMGFEKIDHKSASLDLLKVKLKALSPEQRNQLLAMVSDVYNDVKLLKYSNEGPVKSFKRHLDLIVSESIDAKSFFHTAVYEKHLSVEQALSEYFKSVQVITHSPTILEGQDVLFTALRLQHRFLADKSQNNPIVLYGSFVNGKAFTKSSDLDFAVIDPKLETQMREDNLLEYLEEFPLSEAQAHVISKSQAKTLGYMNPIVILVYRDYITVRVYGSGSLSSYERNQVPFEDFYF